MSDSTLCLGPLVSETAFLTSPTPGDISAAGLGTTVWYRAYLHEYSLGQAVSPNTARTVLRSQFSIPFGMFHTTTMSPRF